MKIEKGIEPPMEPTSLRAQATATFRAMEPGDSILITEPADVPLWRSYASGHAGLARSRGRRWAFKSRRVDGGVRLWRTE
jgi:hypothetical protein